MIKRDTTRGRTRTTRQRTVILEELRSLTCHPTADQLYQRVRDRLPHISLGTIYRNLELLSEQGQIQRLEVTGGQMHFDGNPEPHCHIRCHDCGAVGDVDWSLELPAVGQLQELTDWEVTGRTLELTGYCPACRAAAPDAGERTDAHETDEFQEAVNAE